MLRKHGKADHRHGRPSSDRIPDVRNHAACELWFAQSSGVYARIKSRTCVRERARREQAGKEAADKQRLDVVRERLAELEHRVHEHRHDEYRPATDEL